MIQLVVGRAIQNESSIQPGTSIKPSKPTIIPGKLRYCATSRIPQPINAIPPTTSNKTQTKGIISNRTSSPILQLRNRIR